ncbi:uncharacterized protein BO97DRAFT_47585 [Aspergillus homomorphus CBS 101889]|uniref:Uncharacterized protein n=1 Tax=Aspergillus homomorphus (strain CBS 101889) TaxID=1450537 RepID=A0A395HYJ6_ASPHC|nr:hypothetical protein BO97DRAFT_47585 [Aspergillus homomorphus CBS 101889]RAL12870.1 hypothetical protein BO97DRAFT_47585 [Aspergillus homomorphus CBS 101889]
MNQQGHGCDSISESSALGREGSRRSRTRSSSIIGKNRFKSEATNTIYISHGRGGLRIVRVDGGEEFDSLLLCFVAGVRLRVKLLSWPRTQFRASLFGDVTFSFSFLSLVSRQTYQSFLLFVYSFSLPFHPSIHPSIPYHPSCSFIHSLSIVPLSSSFQPLLLPSPLYPLSSSLPSSN